MPVGGRDVGRTVTRFACTDVAARSGIDCYFAEFARGQLRKLLDTVGSGLEGVGQLAGHGDDVTIGTAHFLSRRDESLAQLPGTAA